MEQMVRYRLIRQVKKNGRGFYLHLTEDFVALARKKKLLSRHLEVEVPESIYEELAKQAQKQVK